MTVVPIVFVQIKGKMKPVAAKFILCTFTTQCAIISHPRALRCNLDQGGSSTSDTLKPFTSSQMYALTLYDTLPIVKCWVFLADNALQYRHSFTYKCVNSNSCIAQRLSSQTIYFVLISIP